MSIAGPNIQLSANAVQFAQDMDRAGKAVGKFGDTAKTGLSKLDLKGTVEGIGRVREAFAGLQNLDLSNPVSALQSLKGQLEVVLLTTRSLSTAMMSLGIGAAVAIGGSLISSLLGGSGEERPRGLGEDWARRMRPPRTRSVGEAAGMLFEMMRGERDSIEGVAEPIDRSGRAIGDLGPRIEELATSLRAAADGFGRTREEIDLMAAATRHSDLTRLIGVGGRGGGAGGIASALVGDPAVVASFGEHIARATVEMHRLRDAARDAGLRSLTGGLDARIRAGREALLPSSMRTAPEMLEFERIAGERDPFRAHAERIRDLTRERDAGRLSADAFRRAVDESGMRLRREERDLIGVRDRLAEVRDLRLAAERAARVDSVRTGLRGPFGAVTDRITELRGLGGIFGTGIGGLSTSEIDRAIGRDVMGLAGGGPRGIGASSALQQGTVEAVAEANRLIREAQANAMDPVERVRLAIEALRLVAERSAREEEEIGRAIRDGVIVLPARL